MSKSAPLLDDLMAIGSSLFGNLVEARHELKAQAKTQVEAVARKLDLVSREEFDAAFAMLSKARDVQEDVLERLTKIEAHLGLSKKAKTAAPGKKKKRLKK